MPVENIKYDQEYTRYLTQKRTFLRQMVRNWYLKTALKLIKGKVIDFGCGAGEFLRQLPAGSIGFDINQSTVHHCRQLGLNVYHYNPNHDRYRFDMLEPGIFKTLYVSHVLEHLEHPKTVMSKMFNAAKRLELQRIIMIVPGKKGYASDPTHRTFVDRGFYHTQFGHKVSGFRMTSMTFFPLNIGLLEKIVPHLELRVVYDKASD